jgi:hypothetical protein
VQAHNGVESLGLPLKGLLRFEANEQMITTEKRNQVIRQVWSTITPCMGTWGQHAHSFFLPVVVLERRGRVFVSCGSLANPNVPQSCSHLS